jgi:hypothetical protein
MMESVNKTTVGKNNVIRVIDGDGDDNSKIIVQLLLREVAVRHHHLRGHLVGTWILLRTVTSLLWSNYLLTVFRVRAVVNISI